MNLVSNSPSEILEYDRKAISHALLAKLIHLGEGKHELKKYWFGFIPVHDRDIHIRKLESLRYQLMTEGYTDNGKKVSLSFTLDIDGLVKYSRSDAEAGLDGWVVWDRRFPILQMNSHYQEAVERMNNILISILKTFG